MLLDKEKLNAEQHTVLGVHGIALNGTDVGHYSDCSGYHQVCKILHRVHSSSITNKYKYIIIITQVNKVEEGNTKRSNHLHIL